MSALGSLATMKHAIFLLLSTLATHALGSPCSGIDRSLDGSRRAQLAPAIAKQLATESVDVLQSFRYSGWSIIYVEPRDLEPAYLFFSAEPLKSSYITLWAGAATATDGPAIDRWVQQNARGIPTQLASCFAFHVTHDRHR